MANPVWVLSVDLQTKTATFQSGMADAAKSARGAFTEIKSGSSEMGGHVSTNMFASRHAVMAVSEAFGDTMPRAITALLVHIGPLGAALEAAFPYAAIALAAVLLIEHMAKLREAGIKLTEDQERFETAARNALNTLDDKLLQAGIKADELRNNHLGALHKQLELIDHQSMAELVHTFGEIAKSADIVFAGLKSHWYTFGVGADAAKHDMESFQTTYAKLISEHKDGEAGDLLKKTRESAEKVLALQHQAKNSGSYKDEAITGNHADLRAHEEAIQALRETRRGYSDDEVKAQQILVDSLRDQASAEEKIGALKKLESSNATVSTGKEMSAVSAEAARQAVEHKQKMAEVSLGIDREQTQAALEIQQASIMERLLAEMRLADRERDIQLQANAGLQDALDRGGKDYNNQLKSLRAKAEEIEAQHGANVEALKTKSFESQYRLDVQNLLESERLMIDAEDQGSRARLAAIDRAIQEEQSKGLENTQHYRELLTERVKVEKAAIDEELKLRAEAGKMEAEQIQRMGELALAVAREHQATLDTTRLVSDQARLEESMRFAEADYALKMNALDREIAALNKHGKDYENAKRALENKETQLTRAHENEMTAIQERAAADRLMRQKTTMAQMENTFAQGFMAVLSGHQSFASLMDAASQRLASNLISSAIDMANGLDSQKLKQAESAARWGFNWGAEYGGPAAPVLAPAMAATFFAGVMAFQDGGIVPGVGRGDTVPAMLEPGEGVVPGGVMDGLRNMVKSGGMAGGTTYHAPITYAPVIHAVDGPSVKRMLDEHGKVFQTHVEKTLRKLNN